MNEYKFICPVCGQHIKCDAAQVGQVIDCPTCVQKIIAPRVPENPNSQLLLKGSRVGDRPPTTIVNVGPHPAGDRSKVFTAVLLIVLVLVGFGAAVIVGFRWASSRAVTPPTVVAAPANPMNQAPPVEPATASQSLPVPGQYWTLDLNSVLTPEMAAAGNIRGNPFVATRMVLDDTRLTLRTADYPPQAGITIFLAGNVSRDVVGRTFNFKPQSVNAPWVNLRYKDAQGTPVEEMQKFGGYALRLELGPIIQGQVSGNIYLCTGDAAKSYVVGNFIAEVLKP